MYAPGRITVPQCDFSCMIGSAMYEEFVLPYLRREIAVLDGSEYHLDGPDAIKHLEAICSIQKLGVIQWVAGAGEAETKDWTWLYDKIDGLGKGTILSGTPAEVEAQWRKYRSRRLYFYLCASARSEVETWLEKMETEAFRKGELTTVNRYLNLCKTIQTIME